MKRFSLAVALCLSASAVSAAADHPPHWTYTGKEGPAQWGALDKGFAGCTLGREQSPVDIRTAGLRKGGLPMIEPHYSASPAEVVNTGHTIQVDFANAGTASLSKGDYTLVQFHFHTPSEERIDGKSFPMVMHFVHRNAAGELAVIGVLVKAGKANPALAEVLAKMPAESTKAQLDTPLDPSALLPANLGYYGFNGSLTTPPCSEGVSWHVLKTPVEMSQTQIDAFRKVYRFNARPAQPLNGRTVVSVN